MRCPKCGFKSPKGFKFCGECGRRIPTGEEHSRVLVLCHEMNKSLERHLQEIQRLPSPQRAKASAEFKRHTGMPASTAVKNLRLLEKRLKERDYDAAGSIKAPVKGLAAYYEGRKDKVRSIEKDPAERKERLKFIGKCASTSIELAGLIAPFLA